MGYTTKFTGAFIISPPLALKQFAVNRHTTDEYPGIWCQWVPDAEGRLIQLCPLAQVSDQGVPHPLGSHLERQGHLAR